MSRRHAFEAAHDFERPLGLERGQLGDERHVEPLVDGARVAHGQALPAWVGIGDRGEELEVAGVGKQARVPAPRRHPEPERLGGRDDEVRTGGEHGLGLLEEPLAVGRKFAVRVEAVVDDAPAEPLAEARGQRGPEGRLDEQDDVLEVEPPARRREAGERGREGGALAAAGRRDPPGARPRSAGAELPGRRPSAPAARRCPRAIRRRRGAPSARGPPPAAAAAGAGSSTR